MPSAVADAGIESTPGDVDEEGASAVPHKGDRPGTPEASVRFHLDPERRTISLQDVKINELQEILEDGPVRGARRQYRVSLCGVRIQSREDFVRRLLQLTKLHLNGNAGKLFEKGGG